MREELRNEETKLVLLKKLKQSQQMVKDSIIVTTTNSSSTLNAITSIPTSLSSRSLSVTHTTTASVQAILKNRVQSNVQKYIYKIYFEIQ